MRQQTTDNHEFTVLNFFGILNSWGLLFMLRNNIWTSWTKQLKSIHEVAGADVQHDWDWLITSQKKGGEISPHVGTEISFFFLNANRNFPVLAGI